MLTTFALVTLPAATATTLDKLLSQPIQSDAQSNTTEAYATELSNVRALPFGFHAVCERSTLKFRSSSTASFIVRNSVLCQLGASKLPVAERDSFMLCSNDPHQSVTADNRAIPKCAELSIEFQEI